MSYANYLTTFTRQGTLKWINDAHFRGLIPAVVNERLNRILEGIDRLPKTVFNVYPQVTYDQVARCLVYELFRLDNKRFFFKEGVRNTSLRPADLVKAAQNMDYRMVNTNDIDTLQSAVTVVICVAVLYASRLNKKVEMKNLLAMDDAKKKNVLIANLLLAQEEITDMRHFNKNKHDDTALGFLNIQKPEPPFVGGKKTSRAF